MDASHDFDSVYRHGFVRVAACTHQPALADPTANAESVLRLARRCHDDGVGLAVFAELTLSGCSIGDIAVQDTVLDAAASALDAVRAASAELLPVLVVGAPLRHRDQVYDAAVVVHRGSVLGVVPRLDAGRQFRAGYDERGVIRVGADEVPFGDDLLFVAADLPGFVVHVEVGDGAPAPVSPGALGALAGATVLARPCSGPAAIGRADERRMLARAASLQYLAAQIQVAAGAGESTTDLAWDGQALISENGVLLAESERFRTGEQRIVADVDAGLLTAVRQRSSAFDDNRRRNRDRTEAFRRVRFALHPPTGDIGLRRAVARFPFVPSDPARLQQDCFEAYHIQVVGLEQRLRALGHSKIVIGVSGGLDSTQALLVAAQAMDRQQRPRSDILAFSMPGFATGEHTKTNAAALSRALGVTFAEIDIRDTAEQMLTELDHPFAHGEPVYDVTFENVQAGLRTDYLFRIANQRGGFVLGTGDLSELALGWCTYGVGDHMSHYNVNAGVPKTLIQHLVRWVIDSGRFDADVAEVLTSVLGTEISPELVPAGSGEDIQRSEDAVGPYALQDFSLYHVMRYGFGPAKIAFLAGHAWSDAERGGWPPGYPQTGRPAYSPAEIRHWLTVFVRRFYALSQFKRSAAPDGPAAVAAGSLSPRGGWQAPSDMAARIWLDEIDREIPAG